MGGILANLFYPNQAEVQHYLRFFWAALSLACVLRLHIRS
jgi:hypothetical protein